MSVIFLILYKSIIYNTISQQSLLNYNYDLLYHITFPQLTTQ